MSVDDEHVGDGHEDTPYVGLIRGISNEVHEHELRMAEAKGFDDGWLAGIDHALRMTRDETKAIRRQHLERLSRVYRIWRRRFIEDAACCLALLLVPALAIWLLKGG